MAKNKKSKAGSPHLNIRPGFMLMSLASILAIIMILPQMDSFTDSIALLRRAEPSLIIIAAIFVFSTYLAAALTLTVLALKKIPFVTTCAVQVSSGFAGKLLPAGIGGFALNTRYLHRQRHSVVQSGAVLALNNALGFIGHMGILLTAFLFASKQFSQVSTIKIPLPMKLLVLTVLAVAAGAAYFYRDRLTSLLTGFKKVKSHYDSQPTTLLYGFLGATLVTLFFASALYVSALALGVHLSPLEVLIVYTAGAIGISLTPTPGGIGGAEAALTAGLVAVGVPIDQSIAVALLYRFVSYWLPMLPGLVMFRFCIKQKYI